MAKPVTDDPDDPRNSKVPAIWLYPGDKMDVELELTFQGDGFMTSSQPSYNDRWRIYVDPSAMFNQYSSTHVNDAWVPYLDYDGFRDGNFQRKSGWCIRQKELLEWQRGQLRELGFSEREVDDANYAYGRMLLSRRYSEEYFAVYPQDTATVETSVSLKVTPTPDSIYRLWLYFVPVATKPLDLESPRLSRVERKGFTVVELAYLTDREIPAAAGLAKKGRPLLGSRAGVDIRRSRT
jgi:hypothetical protein